VAALLERDPRTYGAIVVNPNHRSASLADLSRHGQNQRFVAAKLHPDYCRLPAGSPRCLAVYRRIEELGLPLFLHTWGHSQVEDAASLARAFPGLSIFMFHMGARAWRSAIQRATEYPNLYLEISATLADPDRIRQAVRRLGARRIFLGTDTTLISPAWAFGVLQAARLPAKERRMIAGENAASFFQFQGHETEAK